MSGIDPGRVAEVLVTQDRPGPGRRGSGYRVSGSAVLTAAHVVRGAARVRVRFDADQPGEWITDARVSWADDGVDAAVLTLAGAAGEEPVAEAGFGRVAAADAVLACSAVGFPRFKLRRDNGGDPDDSSPSQYRDSVHATGTIAVLSNRREGTLEVTVAAPERDDDPGRSPWEGMSGAAVWSAGQIIGIVTEHHRSDGLGRLAASRVDRWYTRLSGKQGGALRRLLPWLPVTPGELTEVVPVAEAERLQAGYLAQVRDIAPAELIGRETDLAALVRFCAGPDPYAWWQAGPWAGKSALAAWFVLHPPAGTVVASFFVTSRLTGQADSDAFTEAMTEQLAVIAGEPVTGAATPAGRDRERRRLLEVAAARVAARQQRLVLVIDGLDEDVGAAAGSGLPSIASLLPRHPDPAVRILVTSRPHPGIPDDVPAGHPLRQCERYQLAPSSLARDIQYEARTELMARLHGDRLQVDVIGFITAAGGGLTLAELAELTGERYWNLKGKLGSVFGRSLLSRQSYDPPAEDPGERVYLFAHETLRATAEQELAHDLAPYRERLHTWADDYRSQGWPESTPRYLLRPYGRMLAASQNLSRLISAATDAARQDRMLAQSFGDTSAMAEIDAARQQCLAQASPDLLALARLAISQDRVDSRNRAVPAELASLWARLGQPHRAEAIARSLSEPGGQARALSSIVAALPGIGREQAMRITADAQQLTGRAEEALRAATLRVIAQNTAKAGFWDIAARVARSIPEPIDRAEELCALATRTEVGPEPAGLAAEALEAIQAEGLSGYHRDKALLGMVSSLASAGMLDQAGQAADALEGQADQVEAASMMVDGMLAAGQRDDAERTAQSIRSAERRAEALAAVALATVGSDRVRARTLAMAAADEALFRLAGGDPDAGRLLGLAGRALARVDEALAAGLAANLEARTREGSDHVIRAAIGLLAVARLRAVIDPSPTRARDLATETVQLAGTIESESARNVLLRQISIVLREGGLLTSAWQAATGIRDAVLRAELLRDVAAALGRAGHGEEAVDATQTMADPGLRRQALQQVVEGLTQAGRWEQAGLAARELLDPGDREQAHCTIVQGLATAGLTGHAERLARSVHATGYHQALMLAVVGAAAAATDPQHAHSLAVEAERTARAARGSVSQVLALTGAADAIAARDRPQAVLLVAAAERIARARSAGEQSRGMSAVAAALAGLDHRRAQDLAAEAIGLAGQLPGLAAQAAALGLVAQALARAGIQDEAARAARTVRNPGDMAEALALVAAALTRTDGTTAAKLAREAIGSASLVPRPALSDLCLSAITSRLLAAGLVQQARHAAERIRAPGRRREALLRVLMTTAWHVEDRTSALPGPAPAMVAAQPGFLGLCQSYALLPTAITELRFDAGLDRARAERAEHAARAVKAPGSRAVALSAVSVALSAAAPQRSAALGAEALDAAAGSADRTAIMPILAAGLGIAGHWESARRAALARPDRTDRDQALLSLIVGLVAAREWEHAKATARAIEDPLSRASATCMVVAGLAKGRQWDQAADTAQAISDAPLQAAAFEAILAELDAALRADQPDPDRGSPPGVVTAAVSPDPSMRRVVAAALCGPSWPHAIKPFGLLCPADAAAVGDALLSAPGG